MPERVALSFEFVQASERVRGIGMVVLARPVGPRNENHPDVLAHLVVVSGVRRSASATVFGPSLQKPTRQTLTIRCVLLTRRIAGVGLLRASLLFFIDLSPSPTARPDTSGLFLV